MNKGEGNQKTQDDPWEDLILSILSVNSFPLERTYALANGLRNQGLFDPRPLANSTYQSFS